MVSLGDREAAGSRRWEEEGSVGRQALGAVVLLGLIVFLISLVPSSPDGTYRRNQVTRGICVAVGTDPDAPQCAALTVGGWLAIVVTVGIVLKVAHTALKGIGLGRSECPARAESFAAERNRRIEA